MANYNSKQLTNSPNVATGPFPGNMVAYYWEVSITSNLANGDTFTFGTVPKGFRLLGAAIESTDLDTNGSPTLAVNIGDSGDADRIFAAATIGQSAAVTPGAAFATANNLQATGFGYLYTDNTSIVATVATGPATGTTGTYTLAIWGIYQGYAS